MWWSSLAPRLWWSSLAPRLWVTGVEVGMDTNGRKNRTGHAMENIVQNYLEAAGYVLGKTLFK
ncbi:DpnII family type II restriction endonuclease, partial [Streptococcus ruminantium]|nr:DpnII family type II restriction endonuclease [Streptococcus ruminantium]